MSDPFYSDDGEYLGELAFSEDGEAVLYDEDSGTVLDAIGADGEQLDPSDFTVTGYDDIPMADEAGHLDALEARVLAAEQAVQQPLHVVHEMRRPDPLADPDAVMTELESQVRDVEIGIGRRLLLDEKRILVGHVMDAVQAGEPVDVESALARADWRDEVNGGHGLHDLDTDHGRQAYMAQRLLDGERLEAQDRGEDDVTRATPPPSRESYDLDNDEQRQSWMAEVLEGRFVGTDQEDL